MLVCVLKHTPGVFSIFVNQNESTYSGLEVEVFNFISNSKFIPFNTRIGHFR